jgi:hypothetical protein
MSFLAYGRVPLHRLRLLACLSRRTALLATGLPRGRTRDDQLGYPLDYPLEYGYATLILSVKIHITDNHSPLDIYQEVNVGDIC